MKRILLLLLGFGVVLGPWVYARVRDEQALDRTLGAVSGLLPKSWADAVTAYRQRRYWEARRRYWSAVTVRQQAAIRLVGVPTPQETTHYDRTAPFAFSFLWVGQPAEVKLPPGCVNLALDRPASGSAAPEMGDWRQAVDGKVEDFPPMGLPPGLQWVQVDLGESRDIWAVRVWHDLTWGVSICCDVIVLAGDDPTFAGGYRVLFNNDHDDSAGFGPGSDTHYIETHEGETILAGPCRARYVRLYSNGSEVHSANPYAEVEVWGRAVTP